MTVKCIQWEYNLTSHALENDMILYGYRYTNIHITYTIIVHRQSSIILQLTTRYVEESFTATNIQIHLLLYCTHIHCSLASSG